jgi:hypothetical protein
LFSPKLKLRNFSEFDFTHPEYHRTRHIEVIPEKSVHTCVPIDINKAFQKLRKIYFEQNISENNLLLINALEIIINRIDIVSSESVTNMLEINSAVHNELNFDPSQFLAVKNE